MSSHGCAVSCRAHAALRDRRERQGGSRSVLPAIVRCESIARARIGTALNTRHAEFRNERGDFASDPLRHPSAAAFRPSKSLKPRHLYPAQSMIVQKGAGADGRRLPLDRASLFEALDSEQRGREQSGNSTTHARLALLSARGTAALRGAAARASSASTSGGALPAAAASGGTALRATPTLRS